MLMGVGLGLLISLLSVLPGVHSASLLLVVLPLVSSETAVGAACTAVGCTSMLSVYSQMRQPGQHDVAAKLAYKGYSMAAVRIHTQAVWVAYACIVIIATGTVLAVLLGHNLLQQISLAIKACIPWILGFALATTVWRSSRPVKTAIIVALASALGYWTFNGAALRSNSWVMTPLLSGLFMIGPTLGLLAASESTDPPEDEENHWEVDPSVEVKGAIVGCVTGFLAGIGTSSLVALVSKDYAEEDYLALQASAEAANNFFAILGFVLIGSTRSGTAAAIATIAPTVNVFDAVLYLLLILSGLIVGEALLKGLSSIALASPSRLLTLGALIGTISLTYKTTGSAGLLVLVASWQLSSLARSWRTPNQALLAAMIGPVLIYYLGLTA